MLFVNEINIFKYRLPTFFLVFLVLCSFTIGFAYASEYQEVQETIQQSEQIIQDAFVQIVDSEKNGGETNDLIIRLNANLDLLNEAKTLLDAGDVETSYEKATLSLEMSHEILREAEILKYSTIMNQEYSFRTLVFYSIIGLSAFLFVLLIIWVRIKKIYLDRFMKMKPEVVDSGSR